ncbi:hypothetical protein PEX1_056620 [Penicillium expansum]|uniref:Geminivirus AL1 replication-associated protein catalytic domain-containing protein n=1 Tax=Penicillium expansum TaxID=27334 RepID=A0A0A2I3L7_PENEN|nr:hypothetical protein PEX2_086250 [Penicillium expansum]KGO37682.1 hypothetical protein PEX1_056620 [Penicillium expansum]KGO39911.1 hypothetical protein PEXP_032940 [Penicillium expansum]KGO55046.1 hypothetical protein PEX2_086250 [Penicillium expansum]
MYVRYRASSVSTEASTISRASGLSSRTRRSSPPSSVDTEKRFRHRWVFLTYARCSLESKDDFEEGFSDMLNRNGFRQATYYGCREHHKFEGIHYHVLVNLGKQPNWSYDYARSAFSVEGNECDSLNLSTRAKQRLVQFIENHVNYCEKEKGGDCFGERPENSTEKKLERKRQWEEIGMQLTAPAKLAKLKESFPDVFHKYFNSAKSD